MYETKVPATNPLRSSTNADDYHKILNKLFRSTQNLGLVGDGYERTRPIANYPPYNVYYSGEGSQTVHIEVAVAGFSKEDIEIETKKKVLTIRASTKKDETNDDLDEYYVHRGFAKRDFTLEFGIGNFEVKSAQLTNGALQVRLDEVIPENERPKSIDIK